MQTRTKGFWPSWRTTGGSGEPIGMNGFLRTPPIFLSTFSFWYIFSVLHLDLTLQLSLSKPTSEKTREVAASYLVQPAKPPKSNLRLYRDIMDEPFTGEHWGPGWDDEVHEGWSDSEDSNDSITTSEDEVVTPVHQQPRMKSAGEIARETDARRREDEQRRLLLSKLALRELEHGAYWKSGGTVVGTRPDLQGWAALSLRGLADLEVQLTAVPTLASPALPHTMRGAISASQFQRELLFALTGRPGVMFSFSAEGACMVSDRKALGSFSLHSDQSRPPERGDVLSGGPRCSASRVRAACHEDRGAEGFHR